MSASAAPSFDDIIQADRKRRQAETLANKLLGSGRKTNAAKHGASIDRKASASPAGSLASRVGVQKRFSSATSKPAHDGKHNHDLHHVNTSRQFGRLNLNYPSTSAIDKSSRAFASLQKNVGSLVGPNAPSNVHGAQMSIRGMASGGPYVVVARNFAPGTTAADIESAMTPIGGTVVSCELLSTMPLVMAEIVFAERQGAESVVATFNNQKADGCLLNVYIKPTAPTPRVPVQSSYKPTSTRSTASAFFTKQPPTGPRDTLREMLPRDPPPYEDPNTMDVDEEMELVPLGTNDIIDHEAPISSSRDDDIARGLRNNGRSDGGNYERAESRHESKGAKPSYQDGRYGYGEQYEGKDVVREVAKSASGYESANKDDEYDGDSKDDEYDEDRKDYGRSSGGKDYGRSSSAKDYGRSSSAKDYGRSSSAKDYGRNSSGKDYGRSGRGRDYGRSGSGREREKRDYDDVAPRSTTGSGTGGRNEQRGYNDGSSRSRGGYRR